MSNHEIYTGIWLFVVVVFVVPLVGEFIDYVRRLPNKDAEEFGYDQD